jgi:transcriptional regulator with XRE-family HTH domain
MCYIDFMLAVEHAPQDHEAWAEALGQTIKVLRTDLSIGRRRLATQAGISYSYLSAIENGSKVPSAKILHILANRLGLQPHELYSAAEARLARGHRPSGTAVDDALIDAQERRFLERQAARLGLGEPAQRDELHDLIDRLAPRDRTLILETTRRLVGGD